VRQIQISSFRAIGTSEDSCPTHEQVSGRASVRAFTLIDVLVSLSVMVVLIGLLLPTLAGVRETTRRVVCSSNIRQLAIGMASFADDNKGNLPLSRSYAKSLSDASFDPTLLMTVRLGMPVNDWDGLGSLFTHDYLPAPTIFYCPSHQGEHRFERYAQNWNERIAPIVSNFQYRGGDSAGNTNINRLRTRTALIADGLATLRDVNHKVGANFASSDLSVTWFDDSSRSLAALFAMGPMAPPPKDRLLQAWEVIEASTSTPDDR
jgi:type II secretory pathway pseudopilin PulG